jgi:hypothetical protein
MSGHNKWSTIKHKKGKLDAKRGKLFTKIIRELTTAAREGGGDPDGNPRLRAAIVSAKAANMPGDTMHKAIQRGTGELPGVSYEEVTYEGYGPGGASDDAWLELIEYTVERALDRWCYAQQHAVRAAQERSKPHVALAVARTAWSNYWELFMEAEEIRARVGGSTSTRSPGIPSAPHG